MARPAAPAACSRSAAGAGRRRRQSTGRAGALADITIHLHVRRVHPRRQAVRRGNSEAGSPPTQPANGGALAVLTQRGVQRTAAAVQWRQLNQRGQHALTMPNVENASPSSARPRALRRCSQGSRGRKGGEGRWYRGPPPPAAGDAFFAVPRCAPPPPVDPLWPRGLQLRRRDPHLGPRRTPPSGSSGPWETWLERERASAGPSLQDKG